MYMVLAKVLANRFRNVIGNIVPDSQSAFVKGKQMLKISCTGQCNNLIEIRTPDLTYIMHYLYQLTVHLDFLPIQIFIFVFKGIVFVFIRGLN